MDENSNEENVMFVNWHERECIIFNTNLHIYGKFHRWIAGILLLRKINIKMKIDFRFELPLCDSNKWNQNDIQENFSQQHMNSENYFAFAMNVRHFFQKVFIAKPMKIN